MYYHWLFQTRPTLSSKETYTWEEGELQATILAAQRNDEKAIHKLCHHFEPLVMSIINRITTTFGYQWDDLQMVAWEHFLDLIMHYEGTPEEYLTLPQYISIRLASRTVRSYYTHNRYSITQGTDIDNDEDPELQELLATDQIDSYLSEQELQYGLGRLSEREREIIYKIYYDNRSTDDIGLDLNITGSRVRQLHLNALNKLLQNIEVA